VDISPGEDYSSIMPRAALRVLACPFGLAFVFLAAPVASHAASSAWLLRTWQTEEGLPNTYVSGVVQGPDGFLWIATPTTVARFDGVRFTQFPFHKVPESDPLYQRGRQTQGARRIVPSRTGGLWITPIRGPAVYVSPDYSEVSTPETGLPPGTSPATSIEDAEGNFWFAAATSVVRLKNGKSSIFDEAEGVPRGAVYSLISDTRGRIWLAKGNNSSGTRVVVFKDGHFAPVTTIKSVARVAPASTNGVWIANREHLFKCDLEGHLEDFGPFQPNNPSTEVVCLMEDHAGAVWIGTDGNGLFRKSNAGFEKIETSYPKILSMTEDRENNLWVGTGGGGLNRLSPRSVQIEGIGRNFSLVGIQSLCEDTSGVLWGATQNGSLVRRQNDVEKWSPALSNALGRVSCVAMDRNGALWIGTQDRMLHCWHDNHLTTWDSSKRLAGNSIVAMLPASNGDLWLAEYIENGVQCLHNGELRSLTFTRDIGRINAIAEDSAGNIWFGTADGLLLRADGNRLVDETARTRASGRAIRSFYTTPDGALWIGYGGWGLGRLKDIQFTLLNSDQGLPDDYLSQIISDDQGWFWFGSAAHGIFKIRQQQLEQAMTDPKVRLRPVLYGRNEGLVGMEVFGNTPGAIRSRDGRLWIPMRKGLAVVDPKILRENPEPPTVILTHIALDGQTIASYGGMTSTQRFANLKIPNSQLRLPPGYRHLDVEFTALNFNAPENVHLQYQLENYDNDWTEASPQRNASYPRLAAGDYKFRVRACNADGFWSEAAAPLGFIVGRFFWTTWWFQLAAVALFTSAIIGAVRYISFRRLRFQLRALEQQAALDKERARIARDLHDDLGCSLTHVALMLEMNEQEAAAQHQDSGNGNGNGKPRLCSPIVRQVVKSVDEIIWAISPRNDHVQYLADYIVEFAVEFLHSAGIRPRVDLPERMPDQTVTPEARHNLFLVVKEALNNVVRHAQATEVHFRLTATADALAITIEDNGRGFDGTAPTNATADGLRNMRQRIDEIGGEFQIESRPGNGTKVSLNYPWSKVATRI
jgi:signal transduction histidine kinase/ligand-binding sensor domain-containing protein